MNTMNYENESNVAVAEKYYHQMLKKNFYEMKKCLHPDIQFIGPLAEMSGRDAVVTAAKNLTQILGDIKIRARFASNNQIMLVYDFMFSGNIKQLRAAVLMEFTNQLISKIELFYDGRPFEEKKNEIFSGQNK